MNQADLLMKPAMIDVDPVVIASQPTLTQAIILCQSLSGLEDKELCGKAGVVKDTAHWSRIKTGSHHFPQDRLCMFMDRCGNEAPLFWLAHRRGYELRPLETETQRQLRIEQERSQRLSDENALLRDLLTKR